MEDANASSSTSNSAPDTCASSSASSNAPAVGATSTSSPATAPTPKPTPKPKPAPLPPKKYRPSIISFDWAPPLTEEVASKVKELEAILKREVWLVVEGDSSASVMHHYVVSQSRRNKTKLPNAPVALLLDSFGGDAEAAYCLARLFRRKCGDFIAVVPRIAKSAGTLLALGASEIILAEDAELGPLDVQYRDYDVEEDWVSGLDTVQAVEQLEQSAMDVSTKMLRQLHNVTKKSYNILLPHALHFAAEITKPLFEKIDAVRYSRQHRRLREAQEYAERILQPRFTLAQAKAIAKDLVLNYPTHEFNIDRDEAQKIGVVFDESTGRNKEPIGLQVKEKVDAPLEALLDWFALNIGSMSGVGRLEEIAHGSPHTP